MHAWVAFAVASVLAATSAASFAELSARYPRSAGEAAYVREGLRSPRLATAVGLLVALAGCVSSATIANAFVGYLGSLADVPRALGIALFVGGLGGLAFWGVRESVWAAAAVTLLELGGLLLVVLFALDSLAELPARAAELAPPREAGAWRGILAGSFVAFYAFIGFEDMVNMAEEVRDVRRTLPLAILLTLVVTAVLYVLIAVVAVLALSPAELAQSDAPLVAVYERAGGPFPGVLAGIGVIAMCNGALIQIIMAARVLYGLADQGGLPLLLGRRLGRIHPRTRTPHQATALGGITVLVLALVFPLTPLARATSVITLVIFALVNLSLFRLQAREPLPEGARGVPRPVPALGFAVSLAFVLWELFR
jgi:amino acid transporter